jgi:hypothetical protein
MMLLYFIVITELFLLVACFDKHLANSAIDDIVDNFQLPDNIPNKPLLSSEISVLSFDERYTSGSFGYESYVDTTCDGEYVYIYGYVLSQCSSTSSSTSVKYDWCGIGSDGDVYFNMVRYNNINCVGVPSWNYTYTSHMGCDTANARKPICVPDIEGWKSYGLKQHST